MGVDMAGGGLSKRAGFALVVVLGLPACGGLDSMYPTENADWACSDWGEEPDDAGICQTDNELLRVYLESPELREIEFIDDRHYNLLELEFNEPTNLEVQWDASPVYTGDSETDVIYQWEDIGGPGAGVTWCDDAKDGTDECDQHYVRYDDDVLPLLEYICHETGHAVGLLHGDLSHPKVGNTEGVLGCLMTPSVSGVDFLGAHNVGQINSTYPQPDDQGKPNANE
jgi:hypothetical protein